MRTKLPSQQERRVIAEGKMFKFRYVAELHAGEDGGEPVASCSFDMVGHDYHVCGVVAWSSALREILGLAGEGGISPGHVVRVMRYDLTLGGRLLVPETRTYEVAPSGDLVRLSLVRRALTTCVN